MQKNSLTQGELRNFYNQNLDRIYKFFYFKTLDQDLAEDLTSKSFLRFVEAIKSDAGIDSHKAFLSGIAKNVFLEFLRDKYNSPISQFAEIDFEKYIEEFPESIERYESLEDRVRPYIEMLPDSQKTVAKLRFLEKLELKEICEKLNKDMNYVKTTQKRAIASLKDLVSCTP